LESAVNAIAEALQWLLDALEIWLQCVVRPVPMLNRVLLETTDEKRLSAAQKVWVPSLIISLIVSFPVLKVYGIEWDEVGYHVCIWMITIVNYVATAFIVHQFLLALKLKTEFVPTLVIYTIILGTYAPVFTLLTIPSTLALFAALQDFKQHPIAIDKAVIAYFQGGMKLASTDSIASNISICLSTIVQVFSTSMFALFAESMSQWYGNDRFKCYSTTTAALLSSTILVGLLIVPLQILVDYAFVKAAS
jgi:hypothetical protein